MAERPYQIDLIAGARPNFMKVAPLFHAIQREPWCAVRLVHTGQHFDADMSDAFFRDLELPDPHVHLGAGGGTHAQQTGRVMIGYEEICLKSPPDLVIVVGDVDSTLACTLAAKKLGITVAHLESGLRSRDRRMPEEINRLATDALADWLWTPSPDADENLRCEGVAPERVRFVGNIMIDSYEMLRPKIRAEPPPSELGLQPGRYGVVTLHRPANVDQQQTLGGLVERLLEISELLPLVFPVHPRTQKNLAAFGLLPRLEQAKAIRLTRPLSYKSFMRLVEDARVVITDSGGIQEETTYLNIACVTVRENTERPITVTQGTNTLASEATMVARVRDVLAGSPGGARPRPQFWDGKTAGRIVEHLREIAQRARG